MTNTALTRLRVESCGNGINCPAIDRRADGAIEITGDRVQRPGLPAHEAVVRVPATLLPELANLLVDDLAGYLKQRHTRDLLRIQTLDYYNVPSDAEDFARYRAGGAEPTAAGKEQWLAALRADTAAGRLWRNVHVVTAPLNDYLRYQFEWCYTHNAAAGQQIRILDLNAAAAAAARSAGDYFVLDATHVVRSRYAEDGQFLGAVAVGADASAAYIAHGELLWQLAEPFTTWWAAHPGDHRVSQAA